MGKRGLRPRTTLSIGVIVALVVAVWAALASGNDEEPEPTTTTTLTTLPTTSSATTSTTSTTTTTPPTTSVPDTTDPEARVEEVRLILENLYFRWFDAIYRNDEEAVREAIATERYLQDFHRAVEGLDLETAPQPSEIVVRDLEILRDDENCLVTFSTLDLTSWRGEGATATGVNVLLPVEDSWRLGTAWEKRNDLWQSDCLIEPEL